jgi:ATP-dependent DNA helicase RecG
MFQSAGLVHADEIPVSGMTVADVDVLYFSNFFEDVYGETVEKQNIPLEKLLENMNLAKKGTLNLAGALLFSRRSRYMLPSFIVKAVAYPDTDIDREHYKDSRDFSGKLEEVFSGALAFIMNNIPYAQGKQNVNSIAEPVVPQTVWEELLANALLHRDYFISAAIRIFLFKDRAEIISPGHLPNNLTIENIKAGNSVIRNPILASFGTKVLPYRGLGNGIRRALKIHENIEFIDDREGNQFKVIVHYHT